MQSKLSFDVWDLKAESASNGAWVIYGSLKVPVKAEKLNQVWQVGAKVTNGSPDKHDFKPANLDAKGTLVLVGTPVSPTPASAPAPSGSAGGSPAPEKGGQSTLTANYLGFFLGSLIVLAF